MLTGQRPFAGDTVSDTLASVLKPEPEWSSMPPDAPPALGRLLRRCLEKDRRRRLRDIGEARVTLDEILSGRGIVGPAGVEAPPAARPRPWVLPILAVATIAAVATAAAMHFVLRPPGDLRVQKFDLLWPGLLLDESHAPRLSPDGTRIVFCTPGGLWVRPLDDLNPRLLAGTEGASNPFWSPDGSSIGFHGHNTIWKVPAAGGQVASVASGVAIPESVGNIAWGGDGRIVVGSGGSSILDVSSQGGDLRVVLEPDGKEDQDSHDPATIPGGRGTIFVVHRLSTTFGTIDAIVDGKRRRLLQLPNQELHRPVVSPTGHLLYHRSTGNVGLWAVPLSLPRLEVTGEPFLIARDGSLPSVGSDGSLLYARRSATARQQLVWVDRQGNEEPIPGFSMTTVRAPAISPEGRRVAFMAQDVESWDIYVLDLDRGSRTRLTFGRGHDWDPAWSPDGRSVLFWDGTIRAVSRKAADGSGGAERTVLEDFPDSGLPSVPRSGDPLVFWARNSDTKGDIDSLSLSGGSAPRSQPFIGTPFVEDDPRKSPDGSLVAHTSDESGRVEIYLASFPGAGGKWQVSSGGGRVPRWDPRGGRIDYIEDSSIMEVLVDTQRGMHLGAPRRLVTLPWLQSVDPIAARYTVPPDGARFLFARSIVEPGEESSAVLVRNWPRLFAAAD